MIKKLTGIVVLCVCFFNGFSQKKNAIQLSFKPVYGSNPLVIEDSIYALYETNTIKFEILKFYVSNIQLFNDGKLVWKEPYSFHLYDISDSINKMIQLKRIKDLKFNQIQFNLGIDSLTNVSGAMGGDLDPTKGMYWTWQSGYVNFKLEGSSSLVTNPKKEFQFHLGGYQAPFNTLQTVSLNVDSNDKIDIEFDVKRFLKNVDLSKLDHIMSPNKEAILLSQALVKCFSIR